MRTSRIVWFLIFAQITFSSCSNQKKSSASLGPQKVGLVMDVGGRGDKSFNDGAYRGLDRAKKELGVDFEFIEPGPGADRETALRQFASRPDIALIIGNGFIFTDDITAIAREFPSKRFACIDYIVDSSKGIPMNLVALKFKEEEGSFMVGALAGLMTKTNTVGFIGGMLSPLIKKFERGYSAGVKYTNPGCNVIVGYAGITAEAFKNPGKGKELALGQYSQRADIIFHASGPTGSGIMEAARETHNLVIGVDSDQFPEAPGYILTSMIKVVDNAIYETIKSIQENTFHGGVATVFGLKSHGVDYIYDNNNKNLIPDEIHSRIEEIRGKIISGAVAIPEN
ncbi:MAG: BMP family protein [Bacteroidota bacterium]